MAEMIVGHNALKGIREAVQADIDLGELIYIMDESENELTVVDNTEDTDRAIRYVSHDKITPTWLEGKIVITYSAGWYDQAVDPHSLAEYLFKTVDKHVLQTLEHIVIVSADTERDWDELFSIPEDRHGNPILEVCDLPDECVGIQWTEYQTVVVNLGNIIELSKELCSDGFSDVATETNIGVIITVLHELFHMAQNDPYAPEELFLGLPADPEDQAEAWARKIFEENGGYVLAK